MGYGLRGATEAQPAVATQMHSSTSAHQHAFAHQHSSELGTVQLETVKGRHISRLHQPARLPAFQWTHLGTCGRLQTCTRPARAACRRATRLRDAIGAQPLVGALRPVLLPMWVLSTHAAAHKCTGRQLIQWPQPIPAVLHRNWPHLGTCLHWQNGRCPARAACHPATRLSRQQGRQQRRGVNAGRLRSCTHTVPRWQVKICLT